MLHINQTRAGLIEIYHKYRPASLSSEDASSTEPVVASDQASKPSLNQTLATLQQQAASDESISSPPGDQRRATIELHSPMKRIMDLIGHHVPVIVVDSSQDSASDEQPPTQNALASPIPQTASGSIIGASQSRPEMSHSGHTALGAVGDGQTPQLQTQQQQQHWTIVDTSQMLQQQQQQPGAEGQQQQLIQTSVPNEQFFAFTPFGLQPTSNPFSSVQQSAMMNPYMMQQAQQPRQTGQQMTQSSQNYQQQQQAGAQPTFEAAGMNQVQPIFLSSYVPELPEPGSQQVAPMNYNGQALSPFVAPATSLQQQLLQPQTAQQPNSIQQQIRAQNEEQSGDGKSEQSNANSDPNEDPDDKSFQSKSRDQDEDEPPSLSGPSDEPDDEPSGSSSPSSGSSSYEDKYDSDKDEPQQGSTSRHARQEPASSSSSPERSGLISVGLNNDCLQCICRASSGCDTDLGCITIGANEKYCGPLQLTEDYWHRAGSPGDSANNFSSFEECANDLDCAIDTVTNYMKKYYRDCDDDRNVTCVDYALLHRLQPNECGDTSKLQRGSLEGYWEKFQRCAEGFSRMRNGDDEFIR